MPPFNFLVLPMVVFVARFAGFSLQGFLGIWFTRKYPLYRAYGFPIGGPRWDRGTSKLSRTVYYIYISTITVLLDVAPAPFKYLYLRVRKNMKRWKITLRNPRPFHGTGIFTYISPNCVEKGR